jgi:hypothetical protein
MSFFPGNPSWTIRELTEVQSDFLQRMTLTLWVTPSSTIFEPIWVWRSFRWKDKQKHILIKNGQHWFPRTLTRRLMIFVVQYLDVPPCRPGRSEPIDIVKSGNPHKSMVARSRPEAMWSFSSKDNGVIRWSEHSARKIWVLEYTLNTNLIEKIFLVANKL